MKALIQNFPLQDPNYHDPIFLLDKQYSIFFNEFAPQNSGNGNGSSASDDAPEEPSMVNERKRRRMISNRESARRSRMRKQRHMDELWSMMVQLINENKSLVDELGRVVQSYEKSLEENTKLREETSDLKKMINEIQLVDGFIVYGDHEISTI